MWRFLEDADLVEQERDDIHRILTSGGKGTCQFPFPIDTTAVEHAEDDTGCSYGHRSSSESVRGDTEQYSTDNRRSPAAASASSSAPNVRRPTKETNSSCPGQSCNRAAIPPNLPLPYDAGSPKKYDLPTNGSVPNSPYLSYGNMAPQGSTSGYSMQYVPPASPYFPGLQCYLVPYPPNYTYVLPHLRPSTQMPVAGGSSQMGYVRFLSNSNNVTQNIAPGCSIPPVYGPRFGHQNAEQYGQSRGASDNFQDVAAGGNPLIGEGFSVSASHFLAHATTSSNDGQQRVGSSGGTVKGSSATFCQDGADQSEDDDSPTIVIDADKLAAEASRQRASAMLSMSVQASNGTPTSATALPTGQFAASTNTPPQELSIDENISADRSSMQSPNIATSDGDPSANGLPCSPTGAAHDTDASTTTEVYYDAEDKLLQRNSRTPSEGDKDSSDLFVPAVSAPSADVAKSVGGSATASETNTVMQASSIGQPKTWASLFNDGSSGAKATGVEASGKHGADDKARKQSGRSSTGDSRLEEPVAAERDAAAWRLAEVLRRSEFVNRGPTFVLRGMVNRGNWCYVNASLQALMACPPFYHFLRNLSPYVQRSRSSTPLLDAFVRFANEFPLVERGRVTSRCVNEPLDPTYLYSIITRLRSDGAFKGRQEDAEEFLLQIFNVLHDEMVSCLSLLDKERSDPVDQNVNGDADEGENSEWHQVGPGRKAAITRQAKYAQSPLSLLFLGHLRYGLQQGGKESANLEPFYTLPLDIQTPGVNSIASALQMLTVRERLKGYTGKNKAEVDATRHVTFHELPRILIFQLKYFVYTNEGIKKILKHIDYSMDLLIDRDLFYNRAKAASQSSRQYKLFAVVFHHGEKAEGGHYTVDVFHGGQWNCMDDENVSLVKNDHVLTYQPHRVPYLLFYRRWGDNAAPDSQQQQHR